MQKYDLFKATNRRKINQLNRNRTAIYSFQQFLHLIFPLI